MNVGERYFLAPTTKLNIVFEKDILSKALSMIRIPYFLHPPDKYRVRQYIFDETHKDWMYTARIGRKSWSIEIRN